MHPIVKILLLMTVCQVIQLVYLLWHAHVLHGVSRSVYFLKLTPLAVCVVFLVFLVLRLVNVAPWFGI